MEKAMKTSLKKEDIQAAISYAADLARERIVAIPTWKTYWNLRLMKIFPQKLSNALGKTITTHLQLRNKA